MSDTDDLAAFGDPSTKRLADAFRPIQGRGGMLVTAAGYDVPDAVIAEAVRIVKIAAELGAPPSSIVGDAGNRGLAIYYMSEAKRDDGGSLRYAVIMVGADGDFCVWKRDWTEPSGHGYHDAWALAGRNVVEDAASFARTGASLIGGA
jgi:hypothetical protein